MKRKKSNDGSKIGHGNKRGLSEKEGKHGYGRVRKEKTMHPTMGEGKMKLAMRIVNRDEVR